MGLLIDVNVSSELVEFFGDEFAELLLDFGRELVVEVVVEEVLCDVANCLFAFGCDLFVEICKDAKNAFW